MTVINTAVNGSAGITETAKREGTRAKHSFRTEHTPKYIAALIRQHKPVCFVYVGETGEYVHASDLIQRMQVKL